MSGFSSLTLTQIITSIGGLGTAAFGLVDATKPITGVNHVGFKGIRNAVTTLLGPAGTPLQKSVLATLRSNWINGTDLAAQKAIAKSLIKLNLGAANAPAVATATGLDRAILTAVANNIADGKPLGQPESNAFSRFDLIVTAQLDEAYQRADQIYRNATRALAMAISVILAIAGGWTLSAAGDYFASKDLWEALLVGLLATPLAPIAKDISSALATAVNTLQAVKK